MLSRAPASSHSVQFYEDDAFLAEVVGQFVLDGVARDEPVVLIVTRVHGEQLGRWLHERGHDIDALRARQKLALLDASSTLAAFMVGEAPDRARFRAKILPVLDGCARGPTAIRAYGEMVDVLCRHGNAMGALMLEAFWNELAEERSFSLLCGYAMSSFARAEDARSFAAVCGGHGHVLPSEDYVGAVDEDVRLREIALLQQRARALESEIEDRKHIEERLREALRHRDEFLAVASHELRTPLTVVKLQIDGLLGAAGASTNDRLRERAARTRRSIRRLSTLVDQLLDVSRLATNRLSLAPEEIDLCLLVREVIEDRVEELARDGCVITFDAPPSIRGRWDRFRIEQVVTNLLSNASKYGRGKPIAVRLEAGSSGMARLVVRDHGIGIAPADRERIFGRFERAVSSEHFGGLGLGLWITRRIVETHGGTIRVEDADGPGVRFVVELPI